MENNKWTIDHYDDQNVDENVGENLESRQMLLPLRENLFEEGDSLENKKQTMIRLSKILDENSTILVCRSF